MLKEIGAALQWYAMLGARFFRVFPVGTVSAITLTFLAQLALIASLLLPLKIVMIMSSGNIPNIFPPAINQLGEQVLIVTITAVAVGAFLFNSVATKTIENLATKGAQKVQQHADKLTLFENQEALTQTAILKFSSALASFLFVIASLSILCILYWELAAVAAIFILICVTIYSLVWLKAPNQWDAITNQFAKHLNLLSNIGFLTLFLTIVTDYIIGTIPGFLSVLLSIILARQLFSQIAMGLSGVHFLNIHQHKLKAIAFEDQTILQSTTDKIGSVWSFLTDKKYKDELISRVCKLTELDQQDFSFSWKDTGLQNILHFIAERKTAEHKKYLVKIFDKNKSAKARHETTLLLEPPEGLPSPKLIKATTIQHGFHLHIFDISGYTPYLPMKHSEGMRKFELALMAVKPPYEILDQYQRSRPMLWDRIDHRLLGRVTSVANNGEKDVSHQFIAAIPSFMNELKTLPLSIQNPTRNPNLYLIDDQNNLVSTHWGEWSLDPAGANTTYINFSDHEYLGLDLELVQLAKLFSDLEKSIINQRYRSALVTLTKISELKTKNYTHNDMLIEKRSNSD